MFTYLKIFANFMVIAAMFVACSDSGTQAVEKEQLQVAMFFEELPECSAEIEGVQIYVREERNKRICAGGLWRALGGSSLDSVRTTVKCYTQMLKDSSGVKIICGKDSVGVVLNGVQGEKGLRGETGDAGKNGEKGATGATGDKGDKGPTGYTGRDGDDGRNGYDGEKGFSGHYCYIESDYDYDSLFNYSSYYYVYCDYEYVGEKKYVGRVYNGTDGAQGKAGTGCYFSAVYGNSNVYYMGDMGVAVICNEDTVGVVLNGKMSSFCFTVALEDGSGSKVVCDGDSIGVLKNGMDGEAGKDGVDGSSCYSVALKDGSGSKIMCNGDSVGVVLDGKDGTTCFMRELDDESGFKIICNGDSVGVVKNGSKGTDGKSCTMNKLSDGSGFEILCDGQSIGVVKDGSDGVSCSKELMDNNLGYNLKCGDKKVGEWYDELGLCFESRESTIAVQNGRYYMCHTGSWEDASEKNYDIYGLNCSKSDSGTVVRGLVRDTAYYFCNGLEWLVASELQRNTYGLPCRKNGEILKGMQDDSAKYVCDADSFRVANEMERNLNLGCVSYTIGALQDSAFSKFAYVVYVCSGTGSSYEWKEDSYGYFNVEYETMTDKRDGKVYKIVTIGKQTWMAENLNYTNATIDVEERSSCYEGFDKNCEKYGRLYSWSTAMDSLAIFSTNGKGCGYQKECTPTYPVRGICPEGWHLPTNDEWVSIYTAMGQNVYAMQARNVENWNKGTDLYGFSALAAGCFMAENGAIFSNFGSYAYFWSSTYYEYGNDRAYYWHIWSDGRGIDEYTRRSQASIRCVKNASATSN